jgi:hypothetical protein
LIAREIALPNGRVLCMTMSQWHWEMVTFLELWDEHYGRTHGLIYEFFRMLPNTTDRKFANAVMGVLRDDYNQWLAEFPPGEEPAFPDPRR